jgi:glycosyltransferase involved in cell wall biosynthesis
MLPRIDIVMAIYRPNPDHLRAQLQSLKSQDHAHLRVFAVIADEQSGDSVAALAEELALDVRLVDPGEELDAPRAFEAGLYALTEQPAHDRADFIALCDQDDIWHPDRLSYGLKRLEQKGVDLVHSDARLVGEDGKTVLKPSMFAFERRHRRPGLRGLLYRNNITGMTVLMRRRVVDLALPFPKQSGVHYYHDLWLGLIAAATGGIYLIRKPLVDYRQHGGNVIGAVDRQTPRSRRASRSRLPLKMWLRREASAYALARYMGQSTFARLTNAAKDGRIPADQVRFGRLRPYLKRTLGLGAHLGDAVKLGATGKFGLARIAAGFAVVSAGRTAWAFQQLLRSGLSQTLERFDLRLYSMSPGVPPESPVDAEKPSLRATDYQELIDGRKEPAWAPVFEADTPAINLLVPTLNPTEIFAGIVTALDIGLGLAERGHQVRFIATDLPVSSLAASRGFLLRRLSAEAAATGAAQRISLHCGIRHDTLPSHPDDRYLATAWWTAHVAQKLTSEYPYDTRKFLYLIQDYEPNFYAWGPEFADAEQSYGFDFIPIFNTTLLRDYFARQGFGFATPEALSFHPSIDIARYAAGERVARQGPRRLAIYGRPEVPRNMYKTAIETLAGFIERENLTPDDIEIVSMGLQHAPVTLPNGVTMTSLGKLPWEEYPKYLLTVDVGLALMYSPHPSHLPLELAASGVQVVTNRFGPKELNKLSAGIWSAPATVSGLTSVLSDAWHSGPLADQARQIDLTALGLPPETMLDQLHAALDAAMPRTKEG